MVATNGAVHVTLVLSKTKVAPIKHLTIPHLELCGANLLTTLLHQVRKALDLPSGVVYAWTDSTVVLSWLSTNPLRHLWEIAFLASWNLQHEASGIM